MRTLRIMEHVSLDGVIQSPGSRDEDEEGGYRNGGWAAPFRSPDGLETVIQAQGSRFDLILGRRTYDIWSEYWPKAGPSAVADALNSATKHVATHRPESLEWGPVAPLGDDVFESIRKLKAGDGGDLVLWGSSSLTTGVLGHRLADEVVLIVSPVLIGRGKRLFGDTGDPCRLVPVRSRATSTGVLVNTYRFAGPIDPAGS